MAVRLWQKECDHLRQDLQLETVLQAPANDHQTPAEKTSLRKPNTPRDSAHNDQANAINTNNSSQNQRCILIFIVLALLVLYIWIFHNVSYKMGSNQATVEAYSTLEAYKAAKELVRNCMDLFDNQDRCAILEDSLFGRLHGTYGQRIA